VEEKGDVEHPSVMTNEKNVVDGVVMVISMLLYESNESTSHFRESVGITNMVVGNVGNLCNVGWDWIFWSDE